MRNSLFVLLLGAEFIVLVPLSQRYIFYRIIYQLFVDLKTECREILPFLLLKFRYVLTNERGALHLNGLMGLLRNMDLSCSRPKTKAESAKKKLSMTYLVELMSRIIFGKSRTRRIISTGTACIHITSAISMYEQ